MLKLNNLNISANGKSIIKDFSYNFEANKVYAIMGPNGSGKSTLAYSIAGHPTYKSTGKIILNKKNISKVKSDIRARLGIFLSFQTPLSLSGIDVFQLLRVALAGKKDPFKLRLETDKLAKELKIKEELVTRSLNEGASGGEKKKLEVLQMAILNPKLAIFDEVDTGVDVDALKTIAQFINKRKKNKTLIFITHYSRILKYVKPDKVLIIKDGKLVKDGDYGLVKEIEEKGYGNFY